MVFLRNRLKYALSYDECKKILNQRLVKVDGKVRTDNTYPAGFMGKLIIYSTTMLPLVRRILQGCPRTGDLDVNFSTHGIYLKHREITPTRKG